MVCIEVYPGSKKRKAIPVNIVDGIEVLLFPANKEDFSLAVRGLPLLSKESLHLRFMGRENEDPEHLLAHLLLIDQQRYFAWGAIDAHRKDIPGLGMCHLFRFEQKPEEAEFALTVIDEYQNKGLGKQFMALLYVLSLKNDIKMMTGYVLRENQFFIQMLKKLGGEATYEDEIAIVTIKVDRDYSNVPKTAYGAQYIEKVKYIAREFGMI